MIEDPENINFPPAPPLRRYTNAWRDWVEERFHPLLYWLPIAPICAALYMLSWLPALFIFHFWTDPIMGTQLARGGVFFLDLFAKLPGLIIFVGQMAIAVLLPIYMLPNCCLRGLHTSDGEYNIILAPLATIGLFHIICYIFFPDLI